MIAAIAIAVAFTSIFARIATMATHGGRRYYYHTSTELPHGGSQVFLVKNGISHAQRLIGKPKQ